MSDTYGQNIKLGIAFQNSGGTIHASSAYWIPHLSDSITLTKEVISESNARGVFDQGGLYEVGQSVGGDIQCEADLRTVGVLCQSVINDATTVTSGSMKRHTFLPRTSDFDEFFAGRPVSIIKRFNDGGSSHIYYDAVGQSLTFNYANGELLKISANYLGKGFSRNTNVGSTGIAGLQTLWDQTSITFSAVGFDEMEELSITINEPMAAHGALHGSQTPRHIKREGFRSVEVSGTMVFTNQTRFNDFINQTEHVLRAFTESRTEVQSGYKGYIDVNVRAFRFTEYPIVNQGPGLIKVAFQGMAAFDNVTSRSYDVTVRNNYALTF
jgi:hypothetical protein